eukprot:525026_1
MTSDCSAIEYLYWSIGHQIICISIIVIIIFFLSKFIKINVSNTRLKPKLYSIVSLGILFSVVSLIIFITYSIMNISCMMNNAGDFPSHQFIKLSKNIKKALYGLFYIQYVLLLLIFFIQLKNVFTGTTLRLSKYAIYSCGCIFTFEAICILFVCTLWTIAYSIHQLITLLATIILLALTLGIGYLFVSKLSFVYKSVEHQSNSKIVEIITRTTILITLCIIVTITDLIVAWSKVENEEKNHLDEGIHLLISTVDQFANFMCVMLSYSYNKAYYMKLFSCIHIRCHLIVGWGMGLSDNEVKMIQLHSTTLANCNSGTSHSNVKSSEQMSSNGTSVVTIERKFSAQSEEHNHEVVI